MLRHLVDKVVLDVDSNKVYQLNISDESFAYLFNHLSNPYIKNGKLFRMVGVRMETSATKPILIEDITPYLHLII